MTDHERARRAFTRWLQRASGGAPSSDLALRTTPPQQGDEVRQTLLALRDDATALPTSMRELLGPLRPPTYDDAARLLLWARHAPTGPQCRSFRAALYLLQRLEATDVQDTEVARRAASA